MNLIDNLFAEYKSLNTYIVVGLSLLSLGLVYTPQSWKIVRHYITLIHEFGHAFTGFIFGGKLQGIRLHSDTSGLTTSLVSIRFIPRLATTSAGYLAPSVAAVIGAYLYSLNMHGYIMMLILIVSLIVLLFIRNWFGLIPVISLICIIYASLNFSSTIISSVVLIFVFVSVMGSIKSCLELYLHHRSNPFMESDASALKQLTKLPVKFWIAYFTLFNLCLLVLSFYLLFV